MNTPNKIGKTKNKICYEEIIFFNGNLANAILCLLFVQ